MATLETKKLDSIIASRRSLLKGVGALAATAAVGEKVARAAVPTTPSDAQVLNFALNLEYLEAQFYTLAVEGVTADKSTLGGAIGTGAGMATTGGGTVKVKSNPKVTFANKSIQAYAIETAREERNHVNFLRGALGSGAVAQPNIDLQTSFVALGNALSPSVANFDPFLNDLTFLYGAYIFEDVGVTAYHGGAAFLATTKQYLTPAVEIHAVEAYHAGLIRSTLYGLDQGVFTIPGTTLTIGSVAPTATSISNLRATLDGTKGTLPTDAVGLTGQDDFGLTAISVPLNGTATMAATILDAGKVTAAGSSTVTYNYYVAFARTVQQVLNIVYASATGVKGGFYPNGMTGDIN